MEQVFSKWRRFLKEAQELQSITPQVILDVLEGYGNNTWVFFDTETLGFNCHRHQMTEIAAIAVNPNNWENINTISEFHEKMKLTSKTRLRLDVPYTGKGKSYRDLMSMTQYGTHDKSYEEEEEVLNNFAKWLGGLDNPVLLAHNAAFDMKCLADRMAKYDLKLDRYPVMDTLDLVRYYLRPLLNYMATQEGEGGRAKQILDKMVTKTGRASASLGPVSTALEITIENWHSAKADVEMLMKVVQESVALFRASPDADVRSLGYSKAVSQKHRRRRRKRKKEKGIRRAAKLSRANT